MPAHAQPNLPDMSWRNAGAAMIRDGITTAPVLFAEEADYLRRAYIEKSIAPQVSAEGISHVSEDRANRIGNTAWCYVSLTDPVMARLLLQPDLLTMIGDYYGKQPYFRRMPFIKRTSVQPHHEMDISSFYHIDQGKHFVGIMMLLDDLSESQSHMRYLIGTHHIEQRAFRLLQDEPRTADFNAFLESEYKVRPLVGPKGTMFIYDNGNGIHKGNMIAGTTRDVMQATFSRGDHTTKPTDLEPLRDALIANVAATAPIVRDSIRYVV